MTLNLFFIALISGLLSSNGALAKVPTSWIDASQSASFVESNVQKTEANTMGLDINKMMKSTYAVVSPSLEQKDHFGLTGMQEKTKPGPWFLSSIKTEVGIEAGGDIGLVGVQGEAAIEYIWKRTARSIKKLQQEYYGNSSKTLASAKNMTPQFKEANTLNLATDMPATEVDKRIDDLVFYISQAKKVSDPAKMKYQLTQHVKLHQLLAQKVANNSEHMTWKPYKYQLELYVTAAGAVLPTIEVGGVVRVRIEWSIIEKKSFIPTKPAAFANHIEMITNELQSNFAANLNSTSQYDFYGVKVGIGIGLGGDIGLIEGKSHAIASVFLKYNPSNNFHAQSLKTFSSSPNEVIGGIPSTQWQRGLKKVTSMASFIVQESSAAEKKMDETRPQRDFELGAIEIELEMSAGGEFFLPTVKGIGFMELFFNKKNPLKP